MNSAKRAKRSFELLADDLTYLARICRMVAGMPLAIVLAAAWVESLSLEEIVEELTASIDILESDLRDIPERQRSLQAVFDYAWDRLDEAEQSVFMKLSVFHGGFSRKAGQAIAGATLRQLTSLVNKSLLRRNNETGRYFVHELLRQYGEKALHHSGLVQNVWDSHSNLYLQLLIELEPRIKGHGQLEALDTIETDFENIRAAWDWAIEQRNFDLIQQASESFMWFCEIRSRGQDGHELLALALSSLSDEPDSALVWANLFVKYEFLQPTTIISPSQNLERAFMIAEQAAHGETLAIANIIYARIEVYRNVTYERAVQYFQQALDYYQRQDNKFYVGFILHRLGYCQAYVGTMGASIKYTEQSLTIRQEIEDEAGIARCFANLGTMHMAADNYEIAIQYLQDAVSLSRKVNLPMMIAFSAHMLTLAVFYAGDFEEAANLAREAAKIEEEFSLRAFGHTPSSLGMIACMNGDYDSGIILCQEGLEIVSKSNPNFLAMAYSSLAVALCGLGRFQEANSYLRKNIDVPLSSDWAAVVGTDCASHALCLADAGQLEQAAIGLGFVLGKGYSTMDWAKKWSLLQELKAKLQSELDEATFNAAWEKGKTFSIAEARVFVREGLE